MIIKLIKILNIFLKKTLLGNYRQNKIANEIAKIIKKNELKKKIKILDFGSGFSEPSVISYLQELLKRNYDAKIYAADLFSKDFLKKKNMNYKNKIKYINSNKIIENNFDYCIISDVLHHINYNLKKNKKVKKILLDLKKKSKHIIIKDHFEYNVFSRYLLRILDFLGNFQYDVKIPHKYFTKKIFFKLLLDTNLKIVNINTNISYYPKYFLFFNNKKMHFLTLLKSV